MKYCFDTSALINLGERHYPQRIAMFSPIWDHLYAGIEDGSIVSVDYVKTELEKSASDWRRDFLVRAEPMFLMNAAVESEYASVVQRIENGAEFNHNGHRHRFMKGADPWLIALANNMGDCAVVSGETKPISHYGLGPVCKALGVPHRSLLEFFEENDIG